MADTPNLQPIEHVMTYDELLQYLFLKEKFSGSKEFYRLHEILKKAVKLTITRDAELMVDIAKWLPEAHDDDNS